MNQVRNDARRWWFDGLTHGDALAHVKSPPSNGAGYAFVIPGSDPPALIGVVFNHDVEIDDECDFRLIDARPIFMQPT